MPSNSKQIPDFFQFPSDDDWEGQIKALLHFLEVWHGKFNVEDRISAEDLNKLEIPIPKPLRMLYEFGGSSDKVLGFNNTILSPKNLVMHDDGKLEFYVDNQDILQWAVDITEENPKVYMKQEDNFEWQLETERLSAFLYLISIFEAEIDEHAPHYSTGTSTLSLAELNKILVYWKQIPYRFMGQEPIYYHAGAALAEVNNREDGYYFNCMSKKPEDLAFMEKITDNSWWKNLED